MSLTRYAVVARIDKYDAVKTTSRLFYGWIDAKTVADARGKHGMNCLDKNEGFHLVECYAWLVPSIDDSPQAPDQ